MSYLRPTAALLGMALLFGGQGHAFGAPESVDLTFLGTTDVHAHIYPTDYYTDVDKPLGLAKVYTLIKQLRAQNANTLLVDSGDMFQGSPLSYVHARLENGRGPDPLVLAMNAMRYDAFAVGNHDCDFGLGYLHQEEKQSDFPFLSCNLYVAHTNRTYFKPYVLKQVGGVKVGILGFSPPGIALSDQGDIKGRIEVRDLVQSAKYWIPRMKQDGADVILAIPHVGLGGKYGPAYSGYSASSGLPPENVGLELAKACPQIDVLFAGHSHQEVSSEVVNGVACAQALLWGERLAVAKLHLEKVEGHWKVLSKSTETLKVDGLAPDPEVLAATRAAHEATVAYVHSPIAVTSSDWSAQTSDREDTPIIDLINEVQRQASGAQLASAASFNRDSRLAKGRITVADIARLYPYENTLLAIKLNGKQLRDYLECSARYYLGTANGLLQLNPDVRSFNYDMISGVDYRIDVSRPVGSRIVSLSYQGQPVTDSQLFTMALNSYRQGGGGGYEMLKDCPIVYNRQESIRELIIEYLRKRGHLEPQDVFHRNWQLVPAGETRNM